MKSTIRHMFTFKSKLFTRYLVSYLIIILISLLISIVAYSVSVKIIEAEIIKAHYNSLNQVKNICDNILKELDMLYIQIGFDPRTQMFMSFNEGTQPAQLIDLSKIVAELKRCKLANTIIKEIYIYSNQSNLVLSNTGKYHIDVFSQSVFPYNFSTFEQWINETYTGMTIFSTGTDTKGSKNMVAYIKPLPIGRLSDYQGKMIVIIEDDVIRQTMDELRWLSESEIFIINDKNQVFINDYGVETPSFITYELLHDKTMFHPHSGTVISHVKSGLFNWKYVSLIPNHVFFEKAAKVKNAILLSLFVFSIIGLFFSYLFAKKHYDPIDKLVKFIQEDIKELKTKDQDEYNFIWNILSNTLRERVIYLENKNKQSEKLKNEFLIRLVKGELNNKTIEEMKNLYNISMENTDMYFVTLISLNYINLDYFKNKMEEKNEEYIDSVQFILVNALDKLLSFNEKYNHVFIYTDNYIICLVNSPTGDSAINIKKSQEGMVNAIYLVKDNFRISFSASISNHHRGYLGIGKAYEEAEEAMQYHLLVDKESVTLYGSLKKESTKEDNFGFKKDIKHFTQNILRREFQNAREILQKIIQEWLEEGTPATNLIRYRMNEIIHSFVNSIEELVMPYNSTFMEYIQMIDMLLKCKNITHLQKKIEKILNELDRYLKNRDDMKPELHQEVMRYINDNYHLYDLSISSIADNFKVNVSYLSTQFKKSTGIGPLEYLQLIRVEKAKKLLGERCESLKEIMEKIGFINEVTFIRVFKKYEGTTPGLFRAKTQEM